MLWIISCFALLASTQGRVPEFQIHPSVVGGSPAVNPWPWQVSIQWPNGNHLCGGTLINKYWVLTAAHCNVRAGSHRVVLGERDRDSDEAVQIKKIAQVFTHPLYNRQTYNNDIALLKLSSAVEITSRVSPVSLAPSTTSIPPGTMCVTTGWGKTATTLNPHILQEGKVPIVSPAQCKQYWDTKITVTDTMICAGASGGSTCMGDSGGPLVCKNSGVWYQVGVVSWGTRDCNVKAPGVYARVSYFRQWIDKTVSSN